MILNNYSHALQVSHFTVDRGSPKNEVVERRLVVQGRLRTTFGTTVVKTSYRILIAAAFVAACSTELTTKSVSVRQISLAGAEKCMFLGPVSGSEFFGLTVAGDAQSALNKVRNAVAEIGGNAFVLTQTISDGDGTVSHADAYSCK